MKLERIEDFERVLEALKDPNAQPHKYIVQPYGYCPVERKVTPYRGEFGPEGVFITCLSCRQMFGDASVSSIETSYYRGDLVPQRFVRSIEHLHSRKCQAEELERLTLKKRDELSARRAELSLEVTDLENTLVGLISVELGASWLIGLSDT